MQVRSIRQPVPALPATVRQKVPVEAVEDLRQALRRFLLQRFPDGRSQDKDQNSKPAECSVFHRQRAALDRHIWQLPVAESIVASNANGTTLGIVHLDQSILGDSLKELGVSIGVKKNSSLKSALNSALAAIDTATRTSLMEAALARSSGKSA